MEPTRAKYTSRSPEQLVLVRSKAAKMLRQYAGMSDREVAKALGLDPRDPVVLNEIVFLREHPVVTNPMRRNTGDEWMDEDEHEREAEKKARVALFRKIGPNVGSNAAWYDAAYQIGGNLFLVDSEDGTLDIVRRGPWNERDERYEDDTLARLDTAAEAAAWLQSHGTRSNPKKRTTKRKSTTKRTGGRTAAQENAAKAMRLWHSGKASSLAEAWAMLRR
jgi:hypothetical protein